MIKSVIQHSYFEKRPNKQMGRLQNNPSIGWVDPKSTHDRPLAWGNKKTPHKTAFYLKKTKIALCKMSTPTMDVQNYHFLLLMRAHVIVQTICVAWHVEANIGTPIVPWQLRH